jgi:hypothetical protein
MPAEFDSLLTTLTAIEVALWVTNTHTINDICHNTCRRVVQRCDRRDRKHRRRRCCPQICRTRKIRLVLPLSLSAQEGAGHELGLPVDIDDDLSPRPEEKAGRVATGIGGHFHPFFRIAQS